MSAAAEAAVTTNPAPVVILVCTTCRRPDLNSDTQRPGEKLSAALEVALAAEPDDAIRIERVECLSVCKRPCTVALSGEGRWTYVYGDLDPESGIETLLSFARQYRATTDGIVAWRERPEPIKRGVVARLPPILRK